VDNDDLAAGELEPPDDRDMPRCWWPSPLEYRPVPGWPRYRVGADRSVWAIRGGHWRRLKTRRFRQGHPAVLLRHGGRECSRSVELLFRAAWSPWPDRWLDRIGPDVVPRPIPLPPVVAASVSVPPAIAAAGLVEVADAAPVAACDDDVDDHEQRRYALGSRHGRARLTEHRVREARRLRAKGWTYPELCRRYGVARLTLYYAITGRTWSHVPMET
jgi:hypothetical protein